MPYAIRGNCVVNKDTGKPVPGGCHKDHASAVSHLRALEANVKDAGKAAPEKPKRKPKGEAVQTPEGPKLNISDANHLAMAITALSPGGFRGHKVQLSNEDRKRAISAIRAKIEAMPDGPKKKHLLERLNSLKNAPVSLLSVTKTSSGGYRYNIRSSVNARDLDDEIVSEDALRGDVARTKLKKDTSELWFYHIPYRLGGAPDWRGVVNGSLVETGEFDDNPVAKSIAEYLMRTPEGIDGSGWGISIGFKGIRNKNGVYHYSEIKERSVLPLSHASNPYTAFRSMGVGKMALSKAQRAALELMKTDPDVQEAAQAILDAVSAGKALDEAGVERKSRKSKSATKPAAKDVDEPETDENDTGEVDVDIEDEEESPVDGNLSDDDLKAISQFVIEAIEKRIERRVAKLTKEINEALTELVEVTKDYQDRIDALEEQDEEARELYEQPRHSKTYERLVALSASDSDETELDDDDELSQPNPEKAKGPKKGKKPYGLKFSGGGE